MDFIDTEKTDGLSLFNEITNWYSKKGLDIETGRGQAYDRAASVSSESVGLRARITEEIPKSITLHVSFWQSAIPAKCSQSSISLTI